MKGLTSKQMRLFRTLYTNDVIYTLQLNVECGSIEGGVENTHTSIKILI